MPSIKIVEDIIPTKYLEKIQQVKSKINDDYISGYQKNILDAIEENFGIRPNFEDKRLSESAKQI